MNKFKEIFFTSQNVSTSRNTLPPSQSYSIAELQIWRPENEYNPSIHHESYESTENLKFVVLAKSSSSFLSRSTVKFICFRLQNNKVNWISLIMLTRIVKFVSLCELHDKKCSVQRNYVKNHFYCEINHKNICFVNNINGNELTK